MRPQIPTLPAFGIRARLAAMTGVLRCLVAKPRVLLSSSRIVSNANDRRRPRKEVPFQGWSLRTVRLLHVLVVVLRLIVGVAAVQITGVPHMAADAIVALQGDEEHEHSHENCPNDEDGRQCPPGCPSCHCTHAMSALPVVTPSTVFDPLVPIEIAGAQVEAQGPPNPEPLTLYRPPRTHQATS